MTPSTCVDTDIANRRFSDGRFARAHLLTSPGFLMALALLALNDALLKQQYANWLTGKLSDVAGLFAFPMFWCALTRRDRQRWIFIGSAILFAAWKSPLMEAPLAAWNALGVWPLTRVLDYTDWLALAVLPVAWMHAARVDRGAAPQWLRRARPVAALCAVVLFTATSRAQTSEPVGARYLIALPRDETLRLLRVAQMDVIVEARESTRPHYLRYRGFKYGDVDLSLASAPGRGTIVTVVSTEATGREDHALLRELIWPELIVPLRAAAREAAARTSRP